MSFHFFISHGIDELVRKQKREREQTVSIFLNDWPQAGIPNCKIYTTPIEREIGG